MLLGFTLLKRVHSSNRESLALIIQPFMEALREKTEYDIHVFVGAQVGDSGTEYDVQRLVLQSPL
jgi:hypothetical protein